MDTEKLNSLLPDSYCSRYADRYDDLLASTDHDDQIDQMLAGDDQPIIMAVDEAFADDRHATTYDEAVELTAKISEQTGEEVDVDEVCARLSEIDNANPFGDHLRGASPALMRQVLAAGENLFAGVSARARYGNHVSNENHLRWERLAAVRRVLGRIGLDTPENLPRIVELVDNGPWDWYELVTLDLLWYGPLTEVVRTEGEDRTVVLVDPFVLLNDPGNGTGHDVQLTGTVVTTFTAERPARLDRNVPGWSWDATAGLHLPAYRTELRDATDTERGEPVPANTDPAQTTLADLENAIDAKVDRLAAELTSAVDEQSLLRLAGDAAAVLRGHPEVVSFSVMNWAEEAELGDPIDISLCMALDADGEEVHECDFGAVPVSSMRVISVFVEEGSDELSAAKLTQWLDGRLMAAVDAATEKGA